jgi:hypothetical protein
MWVRICLLADAKSETRFGAAADNGGADLSIERRRLCVPRQNQERRTAALLQDRNREQPALPRLQHEQSVAGAAAKNHSAS